MEDLLTRDGIKLGLPTMERFEAVRTCGELLLELDAVQPEYVALMKEREELLSSYVGEGFAIPHGTNEARGFVKRPQLAFLQFPDGIDWDGQKVYACVAIAASADEHVGVMSSLAKILVSAHDAERLRSTDDPDVVLRLLTGGDSGESSS